MGIWGSGLYSNDDALDVKDMFKDMISNGSSTEQTIEVIKKEFDMVPPNASNCDAWIALADTSWKYGRLTDDVKKTVFEMINSGVAMEGWRNESRIVCRRREKALKKLISTLQSDAPAERKPKQTVLHSCDWKPGQIYGFPIGNGQYGALLVVECKSVTKKGTPEGNSVYSPRVVLLDWKNDEPSFNCDLSSFPDIYWWSDGGNICYIESNVYSAKKDTFKQYQYLKAVPKELVEQFAAKYNHSTGWHGELLDMNNPKMWYEFITVVGTNRLAFQTVE